MKQRADASGLQRHVAVSYDWPPKIGGAHSWLYEVYRRWPDPVGVLTATPSVDKTAAAAERQFDAREHGSLTTHRLASPFGQLSLLSPDCVRRFLDHVRALRRLSGRGATIVHTLRAWPEGFTGLLYKWRHRGTRLITYAHGEEILIARMSRQLQWMTQRVYSQADLVIANSESTRRLVLELAPTAKIVCIAPGVDARSFELPQQDIDACRRTWGWDEGTVVVATVARMEARKNQSGVLRAIAQLRQEGLPVTYVCAGGGEERPRLGHLATELGIADAVRFPGAVSDLEKRAIFAAADVHAMPSIQLGEMIEGFGIVFLEAAAAGLPSVCGDSGGQKEAVRDGETGLVVDGRDPAKIAAALRRLALDAGFRRRLGENGRQWAARFDWGKVASRIREATA